MSQNMIIFGFGFVVGGLTTMLILGVLFLLKEKAERHEYYQKNVRGSIHPHGGWINAIVGELNNAKKEILVQAYSFTSQPIAKALVEAHKRGVHTEIILDKSQRRNEYRAADFTAHMGVPTYIDSAHDIARNEVMVIDHEMVIIGSFNFIKTAEEKNAENILITKSRDFAKEYLDNWEKHKSHSEKYEGR